MILTLGVSTAAEKENSPTAPVKSTGASFGNGMTSIVKDSDCKNCRCVSLNIELKNGSSNTPLPLFDGISTLHITVIGFKIDSPIFVGNIATL